MNDINFKVLRSQLAGKTGQPYWRSLEELAETEGFAEMLEREFPAGASEWKEGMSRRDFLRLMAGSLALAGVAGCSAPPVLEKIVPYVDRPEEMIPGKPLHFATAMEVGGWASGMVVKSHEGRPVKIEGNPDHPGSLGGTTPFGQAAILGLYDPDRSQAILREGKPGIWGGFLVDLNNRLSDQESSGGTGLRVLSGAVTSPTLRKQREEMLTRFPKARWVEYEPAGLSWTSEGMKLICGKELLPQLDFSAAEVVVSLESDFLVSHPASLRYAREFYRLRRKQKTGRLYVLEGTPTLTGAAADHRVPVGSAEIANWAFALAQELDVPFSGPPVEEGGVDGRWVQAVAADLKAHRGQSVVVAGEQQPPVVHALAHAINAALGNVGQTVSYIDSLQPGASSQLAGMRQLVEEMEAGAVDTLLILDGNPVFTAPADLGFAGALKQVQNSIHWSLYQDETSRACSWHIPAAHFLESWSDTRAWDGTVSIVQPLIAPLYDGKSRHEVVDAFLQVTSRTGYQVVRDYWREQNLWDDFEKGWRRALHSGFVKDSKLPAREVTMVSEALRRKLVKNTDLLELVFRADPSVWDGQFANNGWLQETPRPLTKLTWDNAAMISPALAQRLSLASGDLVQLDFRGKTLEVPVWVLPGQAELSVTLHLGYGRSAAGRVGNNVGFNVYPLRTAETPWFGDGLRIAKTEGKHVLAATQTHHNLDGRNAVRAGTLEQFQQDPAFVEKKGKAPGVEQTLYDPKQHAWDGAAWGMSIDLSSCFGCNACVVACQAENNIPIVGKKEVLRHREMHWIRIDTYFSGSIDNPETNHQAVPCMHCENAPCEVVCPVAATVHTVEGLNDQVYNRCIGTRYCSNNCPYKVRRFNFLQYSDQKTPTIQLLHNPNVTVRARGVMEKCTYCVQRINAARIDAKKEDRAVRDGEITPACAAACPAEAIVFGDINDPGSRVAALKQSPLNYSLLGELNTRPRTTYLAKLRNPNPALDEA